MSSSWQNSNFKMQNYSSKTKGGLAARCYKFSLDLIQALELMPSKRAYWIIGDQVMRSGTSIGTNLVESRAASSRLEFKKFHEISLKSANETKYWLGLLKDSGAIDRPVVDQLLDETNQLANMLAASVIKLKSKQL